MALWTTPLTQAQVQAAMTAPVTADSLGTGLAAYFNFDQAAVNQAWPNRAPGKRGVAQGPASGTTAAPVRTTIPTDPFLGVPSLPGAPAEGTPSFQQMPRGTPEPEVIPSLPQPVK